MGATQWVDPQLRLAQGRTGQGEPVSRYRRTAIDYLFAGNLLVAIAVWWAANHDRYYPLVAAGRGWEFAAYAALLLAGFGAIWGMIRRLHFEPWVFALTQAVIFLHFAGGWLSYGGVRLYGHVFAGMRFDKWVHIGAAFAVAAILSQLAVMWKLPGHWFTRALIAFAAIGIGAGVEMYEYVVTRIMPALTTARFEDSLRDLIADLLGAVLWIGLAPLLHSEARAP